MFEALKKQAILYYSSFSSYIDWYNNLKKDRDIRKFYTMMLSHHLDNSQEIINCLIEFQKQKNIKWGFLLQAIWALSLNFDSKSQQMSKLAKVISQINARNFIDISTLLNQLPDCLISLSGLMLQQNIDKKTQRAYTKLNYEQNKYNLLKQNNQGYAKLSLLFLTLKHNSDIDKIWDSMISLIGNFDLDPDRVLDLVLEAYSQNIKLSLYLSLIMKFNRQSIPLLVGQKLLKVTPQNLSQKVTYGGSIQSFTNVQVEQLWRQDGFIPNPKLITMTAILIKNQLIQIEDIFNYLKPSNQFLTKLQIKRIQAGKNKIFQSFKMFMEQLDQKQKQRLYEQDRLLFIGQLLHSTKLALLAQLIKINDWDNFKILWEYLAEKIDLLTYQPLLNNLIDLLQWIIDPIYSKISYSRFFKQQRITCKTFKVDDNKTKQMKQYFILNKQFYQSIKQILLIVKQYIGFKSLTYIKLCRLFKKIIKTPQIFERNQLSQQQQVNNIKYIIKYYLLPGSNYQVSNPTISYQIYQLLELFDYRFRYQCYLLIYKEKMQLNPYAARLFQHVKGKQNIIVNNLSKDNKKIFLKKMAKLTHNQALQVFYWVVRRLLMEDYQAVVPEIVSALNNCTALTLEMVMFVMIYSLTQQVQPSVKLKTGEYLPWFKNIITFVSLFYRKYLQTDIQPIFDYILLKIGQSVRQIEDNNEMPGALLKLLQGLLNKMYGSFMIQQINKSKYQILAAGPRLQFEALYLTSEIRAAKKSKIVLENFFWEKNINYADNKSLAFYLLVLLAQKRAQFYQKSYIADIKIFGDIYDDYCHTLIYLVRFLNYQSTDYTQYSKLLPQNSFNLLLNYYKIPLQISFQIIRPSIKQLALMTIQQWTQVVFKIKSAMQLFFQNDNNFIMGSSNGSKIKIYLNSYKDKFNKYIPISFFTNFWLLSLDSIYFPSKIYTEKIEDLRKKIQQMMPSKKNLQKSDRELEKTKVLFEKLNKQQQSQRKKANQTMTEKSLARFQLEMLKSANLDKTQANICINQFAQIFVQMCLLPRLLLEASQALYCVKFTIQMIKVNKLSSTRSIKLLTQIIQIIMNYLPFATQKQASNCLSIFLSEILGIFINWNDPNKLKQDMKKILGIQQTLIKDNYPKLKQYLLKLFQRVGNLIKSIKDQPYIIKNCLYLLEKVDAIPGYKQQAQQLQIHLGQLKQQHLTVDMKTILQRQITILKNKKLSLAQKIQDKKKINGNRIQGQISKDQKQIINDNKQQSNIKKGGSTPVDNKQKFNDAKKQISRENKKDNQNIKNKKNIQKDYKQINNPINNQVNTAQGELIVHKINSIIQQTQNNTNIPLKIDPNTPIQNQNKIDQEVPKQVDSSQPLIKNKVQNQQLRSQGPNPQIRIQPLTVSEIAPIGARIKTVKQLKEEQSKLNEVKKNEQSRKQLNESNPPLYVREDGSIKQKSGRFQLEELRASILSQRREIGKNIGKPIRITNGKEQRYQQKIQQRQYEPIIQKERQQRSRLIEIKEPILRLENEKGRQRQKNQKIKSSQQAQIGEIHSGQQGQQFRKHINLREKQQQRVRERSRQKKYRLAIQRQQRQQRQQKQRERQLGKQKGNRFREKAVTSLEQQQVGQIREEPRKEKQ